VPTARFRPSWSATPAPAGIEGASHVDLYDKREYIDLAVGKLTDFFTVTLDK
jgi:hypothetical protein